MANFKRRKPRRKVRCTLCTDGRGGNSKNVDGRRPRAQLVRRQAEAEAREQTAP